MVFTCQIVPSHNDFMAPYFEVTTTSGLFSFDRLPKNKCRLHRVIALETKVQFLKVSKNILKKSYLT